MFTLFYLENKNPAALPNSGEPLSFINKLNI